VEAVENMELSIPEAIRLYLVHQNSIVRLINIGQVKARKNENGHWRISRESLDRWSATRKRRAVRPAVVTQSGLT
jgi:hypothetical protein